MDQEKPNWFQQHEDSDRENFGKILDKLECLEEKLDPVVAAYNTAGIMGKGFKWVAGLILALVTLWASIVQIRSGGPFHLF